MRVKLARAPSDAPEDYEKFISSHGPLVGSYLYNRGLKPESAHLYLEPRLDTLSSPFKLLNMKSSAMRAAQAVVNFEKICIYADYDMDGMAGLGLLFSFFQDIGLKADENLFFYQPHRFEEGYGLHASVIESQATKGVTVMVSVDTGTTAFEAALKAKDVNLSLIITDHHECQATLPETEFLINPNQALDDSGLGYLSGTGVAFYFAMALRAELRDAGFFKGDIKEPDLKKYLDYFSLGSIGDVVPLVADNRALVRLGLKQLRRTLRPGLRALVDVLLPETEDAQGGLESESSLGAKDVSFTLIPKLNAASRMGKAHLSTALLIEKDFTQALSRVTEILEINEERVRIQNEVVEECRAQAVAELAENPNLPVLLLQGSWHEGVLGIVAAKMMEEFSRPALVVTDLTHDTGDGVVYLRGSMRAPKPYHCVEILAHGKDYLLRFGGHQAAAGLAINKTQWHSFREAVYAALNLLASDKDNYEMEVIADAIYSSDELVEKLTAKATIINNTLTNLRSLEPLGQANPEPQFILSDLKLSSLRDLKELHVKGSLPIGRGNNGIDIIGFRLWDKVRELRQQGRDSVAVSFVPEINTFRGRSKLQLRLVKILDDVHQSTLAEITRKATVKAGLPLFSLDA